MNPNNFIVLKTTVYHEQGRWILKEICKRCKKHKELASLKPRLCHDCMTAEGKSKDSNNKEKIT
ncbi:MAG: hypothetical protein WCC52_04445 [Nitrosotalea sp.]